MDLTQSSAPEQHLCYVHCSFCNTFLAVGIPCKGFLDTVTVKCGHCNNISFLSTMPLDELQGQHSDHQNNINFHDHQTICSDKKKGRSSAAKISSKSGEPLSPRTPVVVKPPEKKHRLPSAYNRFMKEEIQRIKAANPKVPHREAFSAAAKNWARYIPNTSQSQESACSTSSSSSNNV
uniref:Crabs claw n=4 Tax=Pedicularis TaxID=43174 RepID=A0A140D2Y9_9LAMI|nr:crabs claw [Pedicularis rex subsp. lipskyana]AMK05285.1 crabs claw [Pedicularis rex subsp. rex]AMK05304.1 crabs claw [Pedicularis rex subsp. zayuensis]AMK05287.1 crabs claw [Pedicularis rex subsp. rex]AMK05294.1 crabs claw [Pedicularis rex subsp. rex]